MTEPRLRMRLLSSTSLTVSSTSGLGNDRLAFQAPMTSIFTCAVGRHEICVSRNLQHPICAIA